MIRNSASTRVVVVVLSLGLASLLPGDARAQPGSTNAHDMHDMHEDTAAPMLGEIDFLTRAHAASHAAFVRGVLLMHNFHYPQAAIAFQQAQKLDSTDVMGY